MISSSHIEVNFFLQRPDYVYEIVIVKDTSCYITNIRLKHERNIYQAIVLIR